MQEGMHISAVGEAATCSLLINAGLNQHKISFQYFIFKKRTEIPNTNI
jgi:hypothetical protein